MSIRVLIDIVLIIVVVNRHWTESCEKAVDNAVYIEFIKNNNFPLSFK